MAQPLAGWYALLFWVPCVQKGDRQFHLHCSSRACGFRARDWAQDRDLGLGLRSASLECAMLNVGVLLVVTLGRFQV